ncbi:MAG: alpha/beta fold hydrolase [Hyphomicrobiaceae bacterium]|nr:alpha/beta fold hydrolase [Hyphomicrobiaceae bacterium]
MARRALAHAGSHIAHRYGEAAIDLALVGRWAPARAADLAYRLFCMPDFSLYRSADHTRLTARARHHLTSHERMSVPTRAGPATAFRLAPDAPPSGKVLVVHGWTSEASFMMAIAEPLRRIGHQVVLVDCPAHGYTGGRVASLIDCARAVLDVADRLGPFDTVVAHSMGCLAALMAGSGARPLSHAHAFSRYVLISAPDAFTEITGTFARDRGLSPRTAAGFERRLERIAHRPIREFTGSAFLAATGRPALLLHASDDVEVPVANAHAIAARCPMASLHVFEGLGHRRILYAPPTIRMIAGFLRRAAAESGAGQGATS